MTIIFKYNIFIFRFNSMYIFKYTTKAFIATQWPYNNLQNSDIISTEKINLFIVLLN